MTEDKYEVVDRAPLMIRQNRTGSLMNAVIRTAETGKAIRATGFSMTYLRTCLYSQAKSLGLKAHIVRQGDTLVMWCEKASEKWQAEAE